MSQDEDVRLNRIENKLDNLTDAISKLAVVDARLTDYISASSRLSNRVGELETAFSNQIIKIAQMEVSLSALTRISWGLGASIGGLVITALFKGLTL